MRRILVLVFVLLSIQGFAQPSNYSWYKQRTRQYSFMADSAMYLPRYNGTPSGVRSNESSTISGMVGIDTTNHRQYFRSGSSWRRLANYTELGVDSIWRVAGKDSIFWSKQGTTYKIKDSAGGATPTLQQVLNVGNSFSQDNSFEANNFSFEINDAAEISLFTKANGITLESTEQDLASTIVIKKDSIQIKPSNSILNIDSLRIWSGISDTAYKKPMTWDTRNGRWEYAANWYGSGAWKARVDSTTSSATPTINTDNIDIYKLTAQAADITSFTTNLSGTPYDGDILEIVITGTATRAITWGASFVSTTVTLPTTTSSTTTLTVILQYFKSSSYGNNKWHCVNYF